MPKENRFAGLGDALVSEEENADDEHEEAGVTSDQSEDGENTEGEVSNTSATEPKSETNSSVAGSEDTDDVDAEDSSDETSGSSQSEDGESTADSTNSESEGADDDGVGPAFEFEATTAKSIYVRAATLDRMDDTEFEVESVLRREHEIRDLTGREFHDALLRVAASYPDEIAEVVVQTREK